MNQLRAFLGKTLRHFRQEVRRAERLEVAPLLDARADQGRETRGR
jgi:hypothetical protein